MTETLTDIIEMVDGAFSEMECNSIRREIEHEGAQFAYVTYHGCGGDGIRCHAHYLDLIDWIKELSAWVQNGDVIVCEDCGLECKTVDEFLKVYVL